MKQRRSLAPKTRYRYWWPFLEAVDAMKPNDLLIWKVLKKEQHTAVTRVGEFRDEHHQYGCTWCDGKLFVVRMR